MPAIKPELASGFRDFLPSEMIARQWMLDAIRAVFERFGFLPLETPCIERDVILTGGDPNFTKNIYRVQNRNSRTGEGEDPLALRFDLTVPLARIVAANQQVLPRPFKRYQTGKVFRGERPQAGRFREFTQFDADIVGTTSMTADAEIVGLMNAVLTELGVSNFMIRVNNRKILNGLPEYAGFEQKKMETVLRSIDKLDRDGWDAVAKELMRQPDNAFDDAAAALTEEQASRIRDFVNLRASEGDVLEQVASLMSNSRIAMEGVQELRELGDNARALGVPDEKWAVDLSVARGLGYYTGPVFETVLTDLPEIGSVFSGGRYDDLVARFTSASIPATGASVGVDRLFVALEKLGLLPKRKSTTRVLVLNFDKSCILWVQEIASQLRAAGIPTEFYIGQEESLKGQLTYGVKQEVPFIVIAGSAEKDKGVVQLRNTVTRAQKELRVEDLVSELGDSVA